MIADASAFFCDIAERSSTVMQFVKPTSGRIVVSSGILLATLALSLVAASLDAAEQKLVQIEAKDKDGAGFAMRATETERGEKTSTIKVIRKKRLSSVGSSLFVMQAFYEIAKARKCKYFVNLKEWDDKEGNRIYIGGFTNKKEADLKREFGDQFEFQNEFGQERKLLSVSQFAPLFEQMRGAAKPPADSKSVQPKKSQPKQ
jgi:hypothetical protein